MAESVRKSSPVRPQLAAVKWALPSSPPDTSELDDNWSDERAPRHSFIALRPPRAKTLPLPPRATLAGRSAVPSQRPSLPPSAVLAAEVSYDVWDSPRAMLVLVDLPGVDPEQVSLTLGSHALYLQVDVTRASAEPGVASGHHEITVEVPEGIGPDALDASFADGVLRVRISKTEAGARHISITALSE